MRRLIIAMSAVAVIAATMSTAPAAGATGNVDHNIAVSAQTVGAETVDWGNQTLDPVTPTRTVGTWTGFVTKEQWSGSPYLDGGPVATIDFHWVEFLDAQGTPVDASGVLLGTWSETLSTLSGGWSGTLTGHITAMLPNYNLVYVGTGTARGWGALAGDTLTYQFSSNGAFFKMQTGVVHTPR